MNRVHGVKAVLTAVLLGLFCASVSAQQLLKNNSPNQYVVKKGDTLWDIASVFLNSPWLWPQIWKNNQQIKNPDLIYPMDVIFLSYRNGQPFLSLHNPNSSLRKLVPKVRVVDKYTPITAIPKIALQAFISSHRIVDAARISKMPYVLASADLGIFMATGNELFIKGILDPEFNQYHVYRPGKVYGAELGFSRENTEIVKVGSLTILDQQGDVSRALITGSTGLIHAGDFIVRAQELNLKPLYYLAAAPNGVEGKIIASVEKSFQITRYGGVVLDLGIDSGVTAGHVFNIVKDAVQVTDPNTNELVTLPAQIAGRLMVVSVFEELSYAIVLNANELIATGDKISMHN